MQWPETTEVGKRQVEVEGRPDQLCCNQHTQRHTYNTPYHCHDGELSHHLVVVCQVCIYCAHSLTNGFKVGKYAGASMEKRLAVCNDSGQVLTSVKCAEISNMASFSVPFLELFQRRECVLPECNDSRLTG